MLFQTEFLVKIKKDILKDAEDLPDSDPSIFYLETEAPTAGERTDNAEDPLEKHDIISYRLTEQEFILKSCDNIYPAISFIIELLLKFPNQIDVQRTCVELLQRLFYLVPKFRKNIEGYIITAFSNINEDTSNANKKEASTFLYRLIHRDADPEFKQHLINRESFHTLYKVPYYDPCVLVNKENIIEAINFNEIILKAGFPNVRNVAAGTSHTTYIEVWKPFSILYWSFVLADHDIGFTLTRMCSFNNAIQDKSTEPTVIYRKDRIEASKHHCRGTFLVREPGIFKLDFDNTHSWFNSKDLKYVTFVLDPDFKSDKFAIVNQGPTGTEDIKEKAEKSESHFNPEEKAPANKVVDAYGGPTDIPTNATIHIGQQAIDFSIKNKDKSHQIMVSYRPQELDWDQVNERIIDTVKKIVEVGQTSFENKIFLKIIYDERALKNIFGEGPTTHQKNSQKLISAFIWIEKLQANIFENVEIKNQNEYILERLLDSKHFGPNDNIYAICANHFTQSFQSKFRSKNKETNDFDFNDLCFPDMTSSDPTSWQMRSVSELYFQTQSPSKQISYLATLLINIFNFYGSEISQFIIFEDRDTSLLIEDNQNVIRDIFRSYLLKKGDETNNNGNHQKQEGKADSSLTKIRKAPEIVFMNVKVQEYLKL